MKWRFKASLMRCHVLGKPLNESGIFYFRITGKPPFVTAGEVKIGHRGEWYDCSKAVNELGMPRTPLPETIRKAITWFRENGYLPQVKGEAN